MSASCILHPSAAEVSADQADDAGRHAHDPAVSGLPGAGLPARLRELSTAPWVFPLILSVALAIRVSHIAALRSTLWFDHLDLDPRYFDEWGSRIAAGDWMGSRVFFVDPLYPVPARRSVLAVRSSTSS